MHANQESRRKRGDWYQTQIADMAEGCAVSVVILVSLFSALIALSSTKSTSSQIPDED